MKTILLCRGRGKKQYTIGETMVDDEHFDYLNQWDWFLAEHKENKCKYAVRTESEKYVQTHIGMHNEVIDLLGLKRPEGMVVDHIDWNGLNNQRENLRVVTCSENVKNQRPKEKTEKEKESEGRSIEPVGNGLVIATIYIGRKKYVSNKLKFDEAIAWRQAMMKKHYKL